MDRWIGGQVDGEVDRQVEGEVKRPFINQPSLVST